MVCFRARGASRRPSPPSRSAARVEGCGACLSRSGRVRDGEKSAGRSQGGVIESYLRDTLAVLATVQNGPRDAAGVLALQEQRLGLAVLEAEDLAVATDVELALDVAASSVFHSPINSPSRWVGWVFLHPQSLQSSS
jgi:hypothetical protein